MSEIRQKLMHIQQELNAPKSNYNSFGKYSYRSCEDILEAVKPLLSVQRCVLTISDTIKQIGERYYIEATATILDCESGDTISNTAYAREAEDKKGMDESQITGATSSYARKYALNGLFCIDDVKDADTMDNTDSGGKKAKPAQAKPTAQPTQPAQQAPIPAQTTQPAQTARVITAEQGFALMKRIKADNIDSTKLLALYKVEMIKDLTVTQYANISDNWDKIKERCV